jgi:chromosome partitioning protein
MTPVRSAILLNRCITGAHSIADAREALQGLGFDALPTVVPRLEVYAQSFGMPISRAGCGLWQQVASDLIQLSEVYEDATMCLDIGPCR